MGSFPSLCCPLVAQLTAFLGPRSPGHACPPIGSPQCPPTPAGSGDPAELDLSPRPTVLPCWPCVAPCLEGQRRLLGGEDTDRQKTPLCVNLTSHLNCASVSRLSREDNHHHSSDESPKIAGGYVCVSLGRTQGLVCPPRALGLGRSLAWWGVELGFRPPAANKEPSIVILKNVSKCGHMSPSTRLPDKIQLAVTFASQIKAHNF